MRNILASIIMFMVVGMFAGCSQETKTSINTRSRISVIDESMYNGWKMIILKDAQTGREFLSYRDGLVEIQPKGE